MNAVTGAVSAAVTTPPSNPRNKFTAPVVPANRSLWIWLLIGILGYLLLPWYAQQDSNG